MREWLSMWMTNHDEDVGPQTATAEVDPGLRKQS